MNIPNRFTTFFLLLLSAQTLALEFNQIQFIISDISKSIDIPFDKFSLQISKPVKIKNNSGAVIGTIADFATLGIGASSTEDVTLQHRLLSNQTLYKTWRHTFDDDTITSLKNDGGRIFTIPIGYNPSIVKSSQFSRGNNEWITPENLIICWESCSPSISNQTRSVNENSPVDTNIGSPLTTIGGTTFTIIAGNNDDFFKINNTGQIQVAKTGLDYENKQIHTLRVKIKGIALPTYDENAVLEAEKRVIEAKKVAARAVAISIESRVKANKARNTAKSAKNIANIARSDYENTPSGSEKERKRKSVERLEAKAVEAERAAVEAETEAENADIEVDYAKDSVIQLEIEVARLKAIANIKTEALITIKINNIKENIITNQIRFIDENSPVNTNVGLPLSTIGTITNFFITAGNDDDLFKINNTGQIQVATIGLDYEIAPVHILAVRIKGTDFTSPTAEIIVNVNNLTENTIAIPMQTRFIDENSPVNTNVGTPLSATGATTFAITYGSDFFKINNMGQIQVAKTGLNYEATPVYILTVKITGIDAKDKTTQITININNLTENTITIASQTRFIDENSPVNTNIGLPLVATGPITNFTIISGNDNGFFKISNTGQIQIAKAGLDYETTPFQTFTVKITGIDSENRFAQITIAINDLLENTAVITSQIRSVNENSPIDTHVGTPLSTTNTVSTFTITAGNDDGFFKINNTGQIQIAKIGLNRESKSVYILTVKVTSSDIEDQTAQITININNNVPVIKQFIVTQGGNTNKGRLITKNGGAITAHAVVSTDTYEWSSSNFSTTNSKNKASFVFSINALNTGTQTIKLKVTANTHSSERILALKLVDNYPDGWKDANNNGIADDKESGNNNQLLAGTNKNITSPAGTRILLGTMGEYSGRLTLAQMKQYITTNNLPDNTKDTLTTGDIYDFIVEGLNATGDSTQVIIELTTVIPKNAKLRKYSLANSWTDFIVDNNNTIYSKTSTTCTDDGTWKIGLVTGATCLKLTIKDGSENDIDGIQSNNTGQANGVIESTISIATPAFQ